jgi:hypothetical protein
MTAAVRVGIENVEQLSDQVAVCVVRCLGGSVSAGDIFGIAVTEDGIHNSVELRVTTIWRYGRTVDLLDPPHSARLELTGADVCSLSSVRELRRAGPV